MNNKYFEITEDQYEKLPKLIQKLYEYCGSNYPRPENNILYRLRNNIDFHDEAITTPTIKILDKICCSFCLEHPVSVFQKDYDYNSFDGGNRKVGYICLCKSGIKHIKLEKIIKKKQDELSEYIFNRRDKIVKADEKQIIKKAKKILNKCNPTFMASTVSNYEEF